MGASRVSPFAAGFYSALIYGACLCNNSWAIFFRDRSLKSIGLPIARVKQHRSKNVNTFITIILYLLK